MTGPAADCLEDCTACGANRSIANPNKAKNPKMHENRPSTMATTATAVIPEERFIGNLLMDRRASSRIDCFVCRQESFHPGTANTIFLDFRFYFAQDEVEFRERREH
jgi:hypothetical protein